MRWANNSYRWRRRFALLPLMLPDETVWLQWYWSRPGGDCIEVSLSDPAFAASDTLTVTESAPAEGGDGGRGR